MKIWKLLFWIMISTGVLFSGSFAPGHSAGEINRDGASENGELESITLTRVNLYRLDHGLPQLELNETLNQLASEHSRQMAEHLIGHGHDGYSERSAHARKAIPRITEIGENVGVCGPIQGGAAVTMVMDGWKKSDGHNRTMLGHYNITGIGVWVDREGIVYITQIFCHI